MLGLGLGIGIGSGSASTPPAPVLGLCSFDVVDTAGGYDVTYAGTDLGSASSITVGATSATITVNTATSITFTMPAKSAGSYTVTVTTPGGTSTATLYVESTPLVWLDAGRATLVTSAVTGVPNSANSAVDLSVAPPTSGNRPSYSAAHASFNNQPAITHNGTTAYLESAVVSPTSQPVTIYAVARWNALGLAYLFDDADGSSRVALLDYVGGAGIFAGAGIVNGGTINQDTTYCICVVFNGGSTAVYINDSATPAFSGNSGSDALKSLSIGARNDATSFFNGSWSTFAAFGGSHDGTTRAREMTRLKTKYGIT